MQFSEEISGAVHILHLSGKIMGGPETEVLCQKLHDLIATQQRLVIMDFKDVKWINSSGIGAIIACMNTLRTAGGDIRFAGLHGATLHYFHITKLESVAHVHENVECALHSFSLEFPLLASSSK